MTARVNFEASTHQGKITVRRVKHGSYDGDHALDFSPAEAAKMSATVGMVLSMLDQPTLPPHIVNSPFVVRFFPKKVFALERNDIPGSIPFRAKEGDELIRVIDIGLGICLNEQTLGRAVPAGTTTVSDMASNESF